MLSYLEIYSKELVNKQHDKITLSLVKIIIQIFK